MNEKAYIAIKLIKKHAIPLLFLMVGMALFFISTYGKLSVYAHNQSLHVNRDVILFENSNPQILKSESWLSNSSENNSLSFSDMNLNLKSNSRLQIEYAIQNLSESKSEISLNLSELKIENFKIICYINNEIVEGNSFIFHSLEARDFVKIQIVLEIDDIHQNAVLDGEIGLTFS